MGKIAAHSEKEPTPPIHWKEAVGVEEGLLDKVPCSLQSLHKLPNERAPVSGGDAVHVFKKNHGCLKKVDQAYQACPYLCAWVRRAQAATDAGDRLAWWGCGEEVKGEGASSFPPGVVADIRLDGVCIGESLSAEGQDP